MCQSNVNQLPLSCSPALVLSIGSSVGSSIGLCQVNGRTNESEMAFVHFRLLNNRHRFFRPNVNHSKSRAFTAKPFGHSHASPFERRRTSCSRFVPSNQHHLAQRCSLVVHSSLIDIRHSMLPPPRFVISPLVSLRCRFETQKFSLLTNHDLALIHSDDASHVIQFGKQVEPKVVRIVFNFEFPSTFRSAFTLASFDGQPRKTKFGRHFLLVQTKFKK
jgi:hypothetical protein